MSIEDEDAYRHKLDVGILTLAQRIQQQRTEIQHGNLQDQALALAHRRLSALEEYLHALCEDRDMTVHRIKKSESGRKK
jgi:hypothetical protein